MCCQELFRKLDYNTVINFLDWLENERHVSVSTRNNRLAGMKSFFQYVCRHEPAYLRQCTTILGIPAKKCESKPMNYLTITAFELLLKTFKRDTRTGLRELCIISLLYESAARVTIHLLENGVNLIYIRDLLGHASVTTTEIYSKANPEIKRKHIQDATMQLIDSEDYDIKEKNDLMEWLRSNI